MNLWIVYRKITQPLICVEVFLSIQGILYVDGWCSSIQTLSF